jgi:hypothetical protein
MRAWSTLADHSKRPRATFSAARIRGSQPNNSSPVVDDACLGSPCAQFELVQV